MLTLILDYPSGSLPLISKGEFIQKNAEGLSIVSF